MVKNIFNSKKLSKGNLLRFRYKKENILDGFVMSNGIMDVSYFMCKIHEVPLHIFDCYMEVVMIFCDSEILFFHKDYNKNLYYIYNIDYVYGGKNSKKLVIENIDELSFFYLKTLIIEIEINNEERII